MRVLFVSPYDSVRGPMAEAFALAKGDDDMDFFSAGLVPAGFVRPQAMTVLQEVGLDVSWEHPRHLLSEHLIGVDYLVTISCDVDEPRRKHFQGKRIEWQVENILNKGLDLGYYRRVRDEIETLVDRLVENLRTGRVEAFAEEPEEEAEEEPEEAEAGDEEAGEEETVPETAEAPGS